MRVTWCSDIHLDFANETVGDLTHSLTLAAQRLDGTDTDFILCTGDITNGNNRNLLPFLAEMVTQPFYYVLGNHDVYGLGWQRARNLATKESTPHLCYLTSQQPGIEVYPGCWLVGQDGWYDARVGMPTAKACLRDFWEIPDYDSPGGPDFGTILERSRNKADNETFLLKEKLEAILLKGAQKVVVATHVPPFEKASLYLGKPSPPHTAGWFCNKGMGTMLLKLAKDHSTVKFLVLAGHTHDEATVSLRPNLSVMVAPAKYGMPSIAAVLDI